MKSSFVKIHRLDKNLPLPKYETKGSFAFDLLSRTDLEIKPRQLALVPTNVIIECPPSLALTIIPRSSLFRKKSLIFPHSVGLIDQDYHGEEDEIFLQVLNFSDHKVSIKKGEKLAQGLFLESRKVSFEEMESPKKNSRGGFGSTDK